LAVKTAKENWNAASRCGRPNGENIQGPGLKDVTSGSNVILLLQARRRRPLPLQGPHSSKDKENSTGHSGSPEAMPVAHPHFVAFKKIPRFDRMHMIAHGSTGFKV